MRTKMIMLLVIGSLFAVRANAQWVVSDPGNLAQGIINASKNIVQTSSTAQNMIKNFQETVKIYQQGKEYYDALKSVHNLVKDARKVQKSILLIGEISDIYVNSFLYTGRTFSHRLRIYPTVAGKFRCVGRNEKRGEYQRAFHVGQGTDGRYRPDV